MPSSGPIYASNSMQSKPPSLRRNAVAANRTNSSRSYRDPTKPFRNMPSASTDSNRPILKTRNNDWGTVVTETPEGIPTWGSPRLHYSNYENCRWGEESSPPPQVLNRPWNNQATTPKCTPIWGSPDFRLSENEKRWGDDSDSEPPTTPKASEPSLNGSVIGPTCTPVWGSPQVYPPKYDNSGWGEDITVPKQPPKRYFYGRPNMPIQKIDRPCFSWLENKCTKGDACRFLHDPEAQKKHLYILELLNRHAVQREINNVKERIEGDRLLLKLEQMKLKEEAIKQDALATIQQLILGCALVTCSAGLKIQEVICGFESCRIRIKQLPRDAKNQEIVTLFSQQGIESSQYFLKYVRPVCDNKQLEAEVVTTADIGDLMLAALDSLPFRNEILRCEKLQAGEMDPFTREESINLSISCRAPTSCAVAIYRSMEDVENAIKEKHETLFHGYKIKVEKNSPPTGPALRYYNPTSVRILGLPPNANLNEVRQHMQSSSIKSLKCPIYEFDEFYQNLTTHLTYSSRVKMRAISLKPPEPNDLKRKQIEVKFDTWQDAKDAMDYLSEKKLKPNYPRLYFRIPPRFRFFSSIPTAQYHAQERRWNMLLEDVKKESITDMELFIRFGVTRVFVKLYGSDCKAVGALKVKVENLVKGEKLSEAYWHTNFRTITGREFLESVSKTTKTLLIGDWRLKALKIYYDCEQSRDKALQLVREEVERLSSLEWTVILDSQMVKFFIMTGLQIGKEELGEDALSLDLTSRPQRLIVKATHAGQFPTQQTVDRLIEMAMNQTSTSSSSSTSTTDVCPICYDTPTLPIELGCGHNYCLSCFRHYLVSVPETKTFPLFCMGDEGKCKTPIPIPTLRKHLTQLQFDRLVEIAFFTYIEKNPNKIRYCPTPDCPQVYMCSGNSEERERERERERRRRKEPGESRGSDSKFQQCPSCLISICTSCHDEAHAGITCTEMRLFKDPTEQERRNEVWAQENGVKRCPRCGVWIMKADGCDHMTCHCGAHICWRCMGVFPASEIYEHISTAHNDFY